MKTAMTCPLLLAVLMLSRVVLAATQGGAAEELTARAREYVERLAKGEFAAVVNDFDDTMQDTMPAEKLQQTWKSLTAKVGPLKKQLGTRRQRAKPYEIILVTCQFERAKLDVKVVFNRSKQISGLFFVPAPSTAKYRAPMYAKPSAFAEREVVVGSGAWALPGTLTLPIGEGPFAGIVLVHGSGPQDRDESLGPNKPFCDLAWGLASRGVAVLRYEKRTKHYAAKMAALQGKITLKEETIDDALAAVSLLRQTEKIAAKKVFLLGHSLGGSLVPRIAALDPAIAGFIVLAGPTRPLEDVVLSQISYLASLSGDSSESDKAKLQKLQSQIARVKAPGLTPNTPSTELPLGLGATYWLDLRGYRPTEVVRSLQRPLLILQGGRDYQVTAIDFEGWKNALSQHGNVHFRLYPKLNHIFMEGEGKSTPAEYDQPGHVSEKVIDEIAVWIGKQ